MKVKVKLGKPDTAQCSKT